MLVGVDQLLTGERASGNRRCLRRFNAAPPTAVRPRASAPRMRQRAARQRDLGDSLLARLHDESAVAQDAAADAAGAQRLADVAIEGDQLRPN
jgi:hypothetical protein